MYANYSQLGSQNKQNEDQYNVLEIQNHNHKMQIIQENRLVVVDIYADWCGPCKQTAPAYAVVARQYSRPNFCAVVKQKYEVLDEDEKGDIHGIPVFQFFENGRLVDKIVGADIPKVEETLRNLVQQVESKMENVQGPQANRNTIRQVRGNLPTIDYSGEQPYRPQQNFYHQPYQQQPK